MNLDELQTVQSRERQTDSLQQLRESFYGDVGEFIQQLKTERERAAERAEDPFDSPEVKRLSDDIKTAEQTVEAIYERRVGKVVKMASLAAADMPAEQDGLTAEERDLFETLVTAIENNREHVLDVLDGATSPSAVTTDSTTESTDATAVEAQSPQATDAATTEGQTSPTADAATTETTPERPDDTGQSDPSHVDAADLMGGGTDAAGAREDANAAGAREDADETPPAPPMDDPPAPREATASTADATDATADDGGTTDRPSPPSEASDPEPDGGTATVDRTTVRITDDVGPIYGVDEREYDLSTDDVVRLPAPNADPLVEQGAAERLD